MKFLVQVCISVLILTFISGCMQELPTEREQITPDTVEGESPYLPITTDLSISKPPALGQTAELTVTFSTGFNASNFSASILLPEGLEFVNGNLSWQGEVVADEPAQFKAVVKAVKTGTWLVRALPQIGGGDQLYLLISEDSAKVRKNPFPADSRSTSRRMAVSGNDTEIPSQPPYNYSDISEEPAEGLEYVSGGPS